MSVDGSFKVESSFPTRSKRTVSEEATKHHLNQGILQSDSEDFDDDDALDPADFLSSNIVYQSPYSDEGSKKNNAFDLGPQAEENYVFGDSPSMLNDTDMENTTTFHNSNWAEFPDWSLGLLPQFQPIEQHAQVQQHSHEQSQTAHKNISSLGRHDISQSTSSWTNLPVPAMNLNEDNPLIFLKSQESKLLSSLNMLLLKQADFLAKGHGKVKKVRKMISAHLEQLHQIHQAMNEIYNAEKSNRLQLLQKFQEWEAKKLLLLAKINDIQSDSNEEGIRYRQLLDQSNEVDLTIDDLEMQLRLLKQKRTAIRKELESSQSVIESKTSSYIESLEVIEDNERNVIEKLSSTKNSMPIPDLVLPKNVSAPSIALNNEDHDGINMSILDLSKLNISRFFSKNVKNDVKITGLLTESYKSQVDVSSILDSLKLQVDSINDELERQENSSYKFQESGIIWNESIGNVLQMESSFKSRSNIDELFILKTLEDTLDLLTKRHEIASQLQLSIVQNAVMNEILTIRKALYIITNDETYIQRSVESGINTPSSMSSSDKRRNNSISKSSSNSSFAKGTPIVGLISSNPDQNQLYTLNTASPPTTTLASSGPPIILSSKSSSSPSYGDGGSAKRKSSLFNNFGLKTEKSTDKKSVKKD